MADISQSADAKLLGLDVDSPSPMNCLEFTICEMQTNEPEFSVEWLASWLASA